MYICKVSSIESIRGVYFRGSLELIHKVHKPLILPFVSCHLHFLFINYVVAFSPSHVYVYGTSHDQIAMTLLIFVSNLMHYINTQLKFLYPLFVSKNVTSFLYVYSLMFNDPLK